MIAFTKSTLLSSIVFCTFFSLQLIGMGITDQDLFFQKIELGDFDDVKLLIQAGKVNEQLLVAGFDKLDELKNTATEMRGQATERSNEWHTYDNKLQKYGKIHNYLVNVGSKTLKGNKFQNSSPTAATSQSSEIFSSGSSSSVSDQQALQEVSVNLISQSPATVKIFTDSSELPTQPTEASTDVLSASTLSSSTAALSTIPEEASNEHAEQQVASITGSTSAVFSDSSISDAQQPSAVITPVQHRCNCFYALMRAFVYVFTAAFIREKSA